ncbi:RNA binding domain protein, S1 [Lentisphaera araneosa HTCC2155]|uniref:RNA binding domain protein, S1 n=1 Tax=Lentisphaera araneosa HTCC2155 TaxID=313628 RepID=A6DLA1_9BACT|nr:Tex family protein [Lentisphaera araneosa]EDM27703.1 RNA binding domain protein, S1 [Lentisphaera araneosa HTCC2155]
MSEILSFISAELAIQSSQISKTIELLDSGATLPFIARYRKEATGGLDEVQIGAIRDLKSNFEELDKRKQAIFKSLKERDLLTENLKAKLEQAKNLNALEDYYLPYRPKKKTRASQAREKGLEPLTQVLMQQSGDRIDFHKFINRAKGVNNRDEALAGARDILAEQMSEDSKTRSQLRNAFETHARLSSKVIKTKIEDAQKYRDYFDLEEKLSRVPGHRLLAILRGEREGFLRVKMRPDQERTQKIVERNFVKGRGLASSQVQLAAEDAYKRLLLPSLEKEVQKKAQEKADIESIRVFVANLRELLLAAPLGRKKVLAFDPGFRTGAKVVCLGSAGELLYNCNLFPVGNSKEKEQQAADETRRLVKKYAIEALAVGNGTAGRETELFLNELDLGLPVISVDESGASIYSASESARNEFPNHDLTVRGAVSIGRRLQDPLAELVKLDPKTIGVGQYQHDVDQSALKKALDDQVLSSVNAVGVDLNTASVELLSYVSGIGPKLAEAILNYRSSEGLFKNRNELKKVPRLGDKVFEQAAGFLRVFDGDQVLDSSAVHPESYGLVKRMAKDLNCSVTDLLNSGEFRQQIKLESYVNSSVGLPTLEDIKQELEKPGRDPRPNFSAFSFSQDIHEISDLHVGMKVPGLVTNVTKFGAFVDVGVHQDGLIHISKLKHGFVADPAEVVRVRQQVEVKVIEVDAKRKRISLSLID